MKISFATFALLPIAGALQGDYLSKLSRATVNDESGAFVPSSVPDSGKGGFYSDPAIAPVNPIARDMNMHLYPTSGQIPDATKAPQVSMLNKGTYERLNGYSNPVAVNPKNPFSSSSREEFIPVPMNDAKVKGYRFPDPATTPINPLATRNYSHLPSSAQAPDSTKAPQVSILNKGTYERLNGYGNPVAVNSKNPFSRSSSQEVIPVPMNDAKVKGYRFPDPSTTPLNPLASGNYGPFPTSGQAPDSTKAPQVSLLNKGTYERLNGYSSPVAVNPKNPFSKSNTEEVIPVPTNEATVRGYRFPDPANTPLNPLASGSDRYGSYPTSAQVPDATKAPQVSTLNKGTYEGLNGYRNPVAVNPENPFSKIL